MHDGRFSSIEDVIEFYSKNIQNHANLHRTLKENGLAKKFDFSPGEKDALILFLKTLSDHQMKSEVKWSDPFI